MGLFDVLGSGQRGGRGISPLALAVLGTLAYKTLKGKGRLGEIFGTGQAAPSSPSTTGSPIPTSTGGGLGSVVSGLGAGGLGAGLKDLLDRFRASGHADKAQSWVSTGANHPIAPHELEETLGAERIQWLMEQTGLPKDQLLAGLSNELPKTIDQLTPDGQVPTDAELERELHH